jgi:hypothetical protein
MRESFFDTHRVDGSIITVTGKVIGPFGVHVDLAHDDVYCITHLRTGCKINESIPPLKTEAQAIAVATALANSGFDFDIGEFGKPPEKGKSGIDPSKVWDIACAAHPDLAGAVGA